MQESSYGPRLVEQGPITEEIVFRAAIIPTYVLADYTRPSDWKFLTFATPLWFGLGEWMK